MNNRRIVTFTDLDKDTVEFDRYSDGDVLIRTKHNGEGFEGALVLLKKVQVEYLSEFLLERKFEAVTMDRDGNIAETKEEE